MSRFVPRLQIYVAEKAATNLIVTAHRHPHPQTKRSKVAKSANPFQLPGRCPGFWAERSRRPSASSGSGGQPACPPRLGMPHISILPAGVLHKSRLMAAFSEQAYSKSYALQKLGAKRIRSKQRWRFRRSWPPPTPWCPKLVAVLPHDRCGRFKPNADAAALIDVSALGGYSTDDVLRGQYRCHVAATLTGRLPSHAIIGVNRFSTASLQFTRVIPEIDIWRAANLMLKRCGKKAFNESSTRATSLPPTAITMARRRGAELPPPSSSSLTTYRLARLTDRNGP